MNIFLRATLAFLLCLAAPLFGQTPHPSPAEQPSQPVDPHSLLETARAGGFEEFQKSEPATPEEYREYIQILTQWVEAQTLAEDWKNAARTMEEQTAEVRRSISDFKPPEITPDNGLALYDAARIDGWQAADWLEALKKIGETRGQQAANAFEALKAQQQKLQTLESKGASASPRDQWLLQLQQTRVQAALAENTLRSDNKSWQSDADLRSALIDLAKLRSRNLEGRVSFPTSLLQKKLADIRSQEDALSATAAKAGRQFKNLTSNSSSTENNQTAELLEDSIESQLQLLEYRRLGLLVTGQIWQTRYDLWNAEKAESIDRIERLVSDRSQDIHTWQPLIPGLRAKLVERMRLASANSNGSPGASPQDELLTKALKQEEAILSQWENGFSKLLELLRLTNADLAARRKSLGLGDKMDAAAVSLSEKAKDFWNTGVFTLNDSVFVNGQIVQRPSSVTLGMLFIALSILLLGGMLSSAFSHWLRSRLRQRFSLDATTGAIVQKFTHFILLGGVCLIALAVVKIPLTIFALLGGGAAIAVGFGAQQLVNNLISGIILLFERPIRIGDIIDVASYSGTVTAIGTRCCQLRRGDGVEILIPNSTLLQSTVVNWTLSDNHARHDFSISLAHGAPIKKAIDLVQTIVTAHPDVLKSREVSVFLQDILKDSLVLRVFYWVDKKMPHTSNGVPSELRIAIYEAFHREGILFAPSQSDVHLDASTPLAVQLMPPAQ
jgi:small-conductance mechanosensitive channel